MWVCLLSVSVANPLPPSSMENCNSKIGHFIIKIHFPSKVPLRHFIIRTSFDWINIVLLFPSINCMYFYDNAQALLGWKQLLKYLIEYRNISNGSLLCLMTEFYYLADFIALWTVKVAPRLEVWIVSLMLMYIPKPSQGGKGLSPHQNKDDLCISLYIW